MLLKYLFDSSFQNMSQEANKIVLHLCDIDVFQNVENVQYILSIVTNIT